jgi:hypothetical protein
MEEATKDNGLRRTLATLVKHGWLKRDGKNYKKLQRIDGGSTRFYFVTLPAVMDYVLIFSIR